MSDEKRTWSICHLWRQTLETWGNPIFLEEVVNKLLCDKALDVVEIRPEMLKALDIAELYLWSERQSGSCHFTKGDWRVRLDYLSVTCFNVQGKKLYMGADNKVQLNCSLAYILAMQWTCCLIL